MTSLLKTLLATLLVGLPLALSAQNDHHRHHPQDTAKKEKKPPAPKPGEKQDTAHYHRHGADEEGAEPHEHAMAATAMSHAFSLSLPMNRNGSGTGWLPDASPMYGYMLHSGKWMFMGHGSIFLRYNHQDLFNAGTRGASKFDAPNWAMFMGQRQVGRNGLFRFSTMVSLDPLTVGGAGYPFLFQTGETWQGRPLVDAQHPHDLFSELSVAYSHRLNQNMDAFVYVGYPGEPALGPVAFMHRISAINNPSSPLGHHFQDATHIIFGTATAGFRFHDFKLEGSMFTGAEPDEDRYGFQRPTFDSRSVRLSYNPTAHWALQTSYAYLVGPEATDPESDIERVTFSAINAQVLAPNTFLNATFVWGFNNTLGHHAHQEHSLLLESNLSANKDAFYGRFEWVQREARDLALEESIFGHDRLFNINALTLGYSRRLAQHFNTQLRAGGQITTFLVPGELHSVYGAWPVSAEVYVQLMPGLMARPAVQR